ncbi:TetR/AcrR family transcriptional regulator [Companilactobacillus zhongbaensis]|uniref:TetR/AcrR family transcriptional regulator n=1 Tax=Companilactobacillus zhongbaensis TaxID=2486009 RepID=UPI000F7B90AE|nr:TetR/AcrR family transcriptional regulator [Companilactobacillus zhongbaensis]
MDRKTDRRTTYTINVIKDAFLELINETTYSQMTVTSLCKKAEITRSTFYLHFNNLTDVLDDILSDIFAFDNESNLVISDEDAVNIDMLKSNESLLPACQRVGNSSKYQQLLLDPALSEYIIGKIIKHERPRVVPSIQRQTGLSNADADVLFNYVIHGSFAINKRHKFVKDDEWYRELQLLNQFSLAGYKAIKKSTDLG